VIAIRVEGEKINIRPANLLAETLGTRGDLGPAPSLRAKSYAALATGPSGSYLII
jgi:hypothetical protein